MDIATGAMNTLLPKLGGLLVGEYNLQKGVKGDIKELEKELTCIPAALRKVSEVPADQLDEQVRIWAGDARELSYDIEDAIDTFMLCSKGHDRFNLKGLIGRAADLYKKAKTNHQICKVIKDIMDQVKKVCERHDRYKVNNIAARSTMVAVDPRLEGMYRKPTELVGIDGPKNEIAKLLLESDSPSGQQSYITSIVGFGGMGKTTLANSLLQDLKAKFDCHFFVSISSNPDIMMLFKNILLQLDEKMYAHISEAWEMKQLIDKIQDVLKNRRFLCVIDDLWKESAWDSIKLALQNGNNGSKIIITTRNKAVAEHAGGVVFQLKPLSDDDSRKLFSTRIFGYHDDGPVDLSEITEKILKKCGGVPLAIITVSSLLASKPRHLREWEKVNKAITSGLGDSLEVDKMRKILSLSYNDLPFHLKTCLLSLSKYPEDEDIRKDVLVSSWIAEGFIAEETRPVGTSLMEIGEGYFNELINRSLIQPVSIRAYSDHDGKVHVCQVHDMVLELINRLASEQGYVTTTSLSDGPLTSAALKKKIRRLSVHKSNGTYGSPKARELLSSVRSLSLFCTAVLMPPLSCFRVIRVLQIEDCTGLGKNRLNDICKLRHLRFLRLGKYIGTKLPKSIRKLESLETLDIRGGHLRRDVVLLPRSFIKLRKLMRLYAGRVELAQGLTLGDMKSLQEIEICSTPEVIKEIGNLKELRTLKIIFDYYGDFDFTDAIPTCLQNCTNLQDLEFGVNAVTLMAVEMQQVPSGLKRFVCNIGIIAEFPRWINSSTLSCLSTLSIQLTSEELLPQYFEKLGELPSLRFLRLISSICCLAEQYKKLTIHRGERSSFRCLRDFHFYSASMLPAFQSGAMPEVERLYLRFFLETGKTSISDFGWENLHSLRHVIIHFNNDEGKEVRDTIREALKEHPNHPSLKLL